MNKTAIVLVVAAVIVVILRKKNRVGVSNKLKSAVAGVEDNPRTMYDTCKNKVIGMLPEEYVEPFNRSCDALEATLATSTVVDAVHAKDINDIGNLLASMWYLYSSATYTNSLLLEDALKMFVDQVRYAARGLPETGINLCMWHAKLIVDILLGKAEMVA